jgi:hypothetical protein
MVLRFARRQVSTENEHDISARAYHLLRLFRLTIRDNFVESNDVFALCTEFAEKHGRGHNHSCCAPFTKCSATAFGTAALYHALHSLVHSQASWQSSAQMFGLSEHRHTRSTWTRQRIALTVAANAAASAPGETNCPSCSRSHKSNALMAAFEFHNGLCAGAVVQLLSARAAAAQMHMELKSWLDHHANVHLWFDRQASLVCERDSRCVACYCVAHAVLRKIKPFESLRFRVFFSNKERSLKLTRAQQKEKKRLQRSRFISQTSDLDLDPKRT